MRFGNFQGVPPQFNYFKSVTRIRIYKIKRYMRFGLLVYKTLLSMQKCYLIFVFPLAEKPSEPPDFNNL